MKVIKKKKTNKDIFEIKCPYCKSKIIDGEEFNNIIKCNNCNKSFRLINNEDN